MRLGNGVFLVKERNITREVDLKNRRVVLINHDEKTFRDVSLYSIIGYRDAEFKNRLLLRSALQAGRVKPDLFDLFEVETLFGLKEKPGGKSDVEQSRETDANIFRRKGEKVVEYTLSDLSLTPAEASLLGKFLLYEGNLHPDILATLLAERRIPNVLTYRFKNLGATF